MDKVYILVMIHEIEGKRSTSIEDMGFYSYNKAEGWAENLTIEDDGWEELDEKEPSGSEDVDKSCVRFFKKGNDKIWYCITSIDVQ